MSIRPALQVPLLEQVLADHRAGRLDAAEAGYLAILAAEPDHPDALHLLGVAAHQAGRSEEAVALIACAIDQHPLEAIYFCNLGDALRAAGRVGEAEAALRQALALDPGLAEAHNNLGLTLQASRQDDAARRAFLRALTLNPHLIDAEINLANGLASEGLVVEASERLERVLRLAPDHVKAHYNLANALCRQDLLGSAIAHYRAALARQPTYAEAWNNLGLALGRRGEVEEALAAFETALRLVPDYPEALNNLGLARLRAGDGAAARTTLERAIALAPALAPPHNNLGTLLRREGRIEDALAAYRAAIGLAPGYVEARANLIGTLLDAGAIDDAVAAWRDAVEHGADQPDITANLLNQLQDTCRFDLLAEVEARVDADTGLALADGRRPGETPLGGYKRHLDPAFHRRLATAWARGLEEQVARLGLQFDHRARRGPRERLRVGWLSADFRDHPVAHQVIGVLEAHDPDAVEMVAYGYGGSCSGTERGRIRAAANRFVELDGIDDRDCARLIYHDEIDILVDLTGYTHDTRVLIPALRPAPVQVGWLGMLGTTGGGFLDYLLADPICVPSAEFEHYSERIVHLPGSCLPFGEDARPTSGGCRRSDFGLPEAGFVFVCLGAPCKIEPVMFDVWMKLLGAVPDSVLWLYRGREEVVANLRREAEARGVSGRRLVFADRVPYAENLKRLTLADLALDTRVYNGGLTTANALWAGVPVIGLIGSDFTSRMASSMLTTLGLGDLLASSLDDYLAKATDLASSPEQIAATKARLDRALGVRPLFDPERFARGLEQAYRQMWDRFERDLPPKPFAVSPPPSPAERCRGPVSG